MEKLFGTDGIRGMANKYPVTPEMALAVGKAVAHFFKNENEKTSIIIGKDTRISGSMLENALASGACSRGADIYCAGIIPTPGVAVLTKTTKSIAGIMISASHNPYYDNGIKIFNKNGIKLSDDQEKKIEKLISDNYFLAENENYHKIGSVVDISLEGKKQYINFLLKTFDNLCNFKKIKIIVDCANGATSTVAAELFEKFGFNFKIIFNKFDGKNINQNCGSQHPEKLRQKVLEQKADIGLAFDGDGDRLIVVDEKGNILTGDHILAVLANHLKQNGKLSNNTVVSTVMSNIGLTMALKAMGIDHIKTDVGDRNVLSEMLKQKSIIGGEDSGHIILLDHHVTGDGILCALMLIQIMQKQAKLLSELTNVITIYPQVLINVKVEKKPPMETLKRIAAEKKSIEKKLGKQGRVLIRYSGTQPLIRIMVEGPTIDDTQKYCRQLAEIVKQELCK